MKINSRFAGLSPWRHRFTSRPVRVALWWKVWHFFPPPLKELHFLVRQDLFIIEALGSRPRIDGMTGRVISLRTDLYLTTLNTHNGQISVTAVRFEAAIPLSQRPHTYTSQTAQPLGSDGKFATGEGSPSAFRFPSLLLTFRTKSCMTDTLQI